MKISTRLTLFFLLFSATLLAQQLPNSICGLPSITQIPISAQLTIENLSKLTATTFRVRKNVLSTGNDFITIDCDLLFTSEQFDIYGEIAQIDSGTITTSAVDSMASYFSSLTFAGSIDSTRGIKSIADEIFGNPPDVDGDGKMVILLLDVRDNYDDGANETFVAGYFDPIDQEVGGGNHQDIIYIDTYPAMISGEGSINSYSTLAHEYQHLIHFGQDRDEETWVNEGLSELAPVLMGLPHRSFSHYLTNTTAALTKFDGTLEDYARTALFFLYSWIQLGTDFIKELVIDGDNGLVGFSSTLPRYSDRNLDRFINNWHIANYVNGTGEYGYNGHSGIPKPVIHAAKYSYPTAISATMNEYGAHWSLISRGEQLTLTATTTGGISSTLFKGSDLTPISADEIFTTGFTDPQYGSSYTDLYLLLTTDHLGATAKLQIDAVGNYDAVTLNYDDNIDVSDHLFINLSENQAVVSYDIPADGLDIASVAFVPFTGDSVTLSIYANELSTQGLVHKETIRSVYPFRWANYYLPAGIDISDKTIYVGIATHAIGYNESTQTDHSYLAAHDANTKIALSELTLSDGSSLNGNWSVRLTYLKQGSPFALVAIDSLVSPFYQNPFVLTNAAADVVYIDVDYAGTVELTIYNLLGQAIWKTSRAENDRTPLNWGGVDHLGKPSPSGIYIGQIRAGDLTTSRKLTLVR